jgi:hypothetical protein
MGKHGFNCSKIPYECSFERREFPGAENRKQRTGNRRQKTEDPSLPKGFAEAGREQNTEDRGIGIENGEPGADAQNRKSSTIPTIETIQANKRA